jgi:hypothetical protein
MQYFGKRQEENRDNFSFVLKRIIFFDANPKILIASFKIVAKSDNF